MRIGDVSACVLAGGYSSRMGRDKAALTIGGKSFLELQIDKLREMGIGDIMLSGCVREAAGARVIPDIIAHRGPLSGVHACLRAARNEACLVLGVDVPLVPKIQLEKLVASHAGGITVTVHNGKQEPLMAVYDRCVCQTAEEILLSGKPRLMSLLEAVGTRLCAYDGDERLLLNCNTPPDYERILQLYSERSAR